MSKVVNQQKAFDAVRQRAKRGDLIKWDGNSVGKDDPGDSRITFGSCQRSWWRTGWESYNSSKVVLTTLTSVSVKSLGINGSNQWRQRERIGQRNAIICLVQVSKVSDDVIDFVPIGLLYLIEKSCNRKINRQQRFHFGTRIAQQSHHSPSTDNPSRCSSASLIERYFRFRCIMCISSGYRMSFRTCSWEKKNSSVVTIKCVGGTGDWWPCNAYIIIG